MKQYNLNDLKNEKLPAYYKPEIRELAFQNGITFPSENELIMLLLGKGTKFLHIEDLSLEVLKVINFSDEKNLLGNLMTIKGIGKSRALSIAAALELGRRKSCHLQKKIEKPADIVPFVKQYALESVEHFITVTLNGANEILKIRLISTGTSNKALIHPREVFSQAVQEKASGIICCHNHPYGPCIPSKADIESTEVLKKAAEILGISFMDHIIFNLETYYSFLEHKIIFGEE